MGNVLFVMRILRDEGGMIQDWWCDQTTRLI